MPGSELQNFSKRYDVQLNIMAKGLALTAV